MGRKCCWLAKETRLGWALGFCYGEDKPRYVNFYFENIDDIKNALKLNVVFVSMKEGDGEAWKVSEEKRKVAKSYSVEKQVVNAIAADAKKQGRPEGNLVNEILRKEYKIK